MPKHISSQPAASPCQLESCMMPMRWAGRGIKGLICLSWLFWYLQKTNKQTNKGRATTEKSHNVRMACWRSQFPFAARTGRMSFLTVIS